MTSTWRRVIRLAVEWSRERVGIWLKTAWSGQGCAGCHPERKRCWTYEPPTSMASGMPSGTSTSRRRMNGFTAKYGRLGEVNPVVTPKRIRFLDYCEYRRNHLPIGSGVTEAACKTVFTQRLKQSGMTWSLEGGQWI